MAADILKKLQTKRGARLRLIKVPKPIASALKAGGIAEAKPGTAFEGALVFCEGPDDVGAFLSEVLDGLPEDGLLWFAYRKGAAAKASGLNRDVGWAPLAKAGYRGVRSVSFDDEWTGLRFRETSKVKPR